MRMTFLFCVLQAAMLSVLVLLRVSVLWCPHLRAS